MVAPFHSRNPLRKDVNYESCFCRHQLFRVMILFPRRHSSVASLLFRHKPRNLKMGNFWSKSIAWPEVSLLHRRKKIGCHFRFWSGPGQGPLFLSNTEWDATKADGRHCIEVGTAMRLIGRGTLVEVTRFGKKQMGGRRCHYPGTIFGILRDRRSYIGLRQTEKLEAVSTFKHQQRAAAGHRHDSWHRVCCSIADGHGEMLHWCNFAVNGRIPEMTALAGVCNSQAGFPPFDPGNQSDCRHEPPELFAHVLEPGYEGPFTRMPKS